MQHALEEAFLEQENLKKQLHTAQKADVAALESQLVAAMYKSRGSRERSFSLSTIAVCTLYALCAHTAWYHRVRGASGWIDINDSVVI